MANTVTYDISYAVVLGDLGPPLAMTLLANGVPFVLQDTDAVTLAYEDDQGGEFSVSASIVDASAGQVVVHWAVGDLTAVGNFHGQMKVQRAGEDYPQTFPSTTLIAWKVTPAISPAVPGENFINDNASAIVQLAPVYQTAAGHCDLAANDTQAHATVAGLVLDATIAPGASGRVQTSGVVIAPTSAWDAVTGQTGGLTPGPYWQGAQGLLTSTPPLNDTWLTFVGLAESATMFTLMPGAAVGPVERAGAMTPIFQIEGQSNAVGNAQFSTASPQNQATYGAPYSPVTLAQDLAGNIAGGYVQIPTGPVAVRGAKYFTFTTGNFGIEVSFARAMIAAGIKHSIVKSAVGSTSLASDQSPWNNAPPSSGVVTNTNPNIFRRSVRFQRAQELALNGYVAGCIWDQGENDAANAGFAANYLANLTAWAAEKRKTWPSLPIVVVRLPAGGSNPYQATVIAAQNAFVAATPNTAIVNTDDLPLQVDGLHYTADGYVTLGQRCASAMLSLQLLAQPASRPAYTTDATSGAPKPDGPIEWDNFHVAAGIAPINPPSFHHRMQDILTPTTFAATTNLMQDSSGGWNLPNVAATPPVQQAIPGYATKGIAFTGGSTTEQWQTASGWGYDMSAGSVLVCLKLYIPTAPSTYRSIFGMTMASGAVVRLDVAQSGQLRIASNNTTTLTVNSHVRATPFWVCLLHNKTAGTFTMFSSLEKLTLPYLAQTVDGQKGFGAFSGFQAHAACTLMDHVDYVGAAAEAFATSATMKAWLVGMGETIPWS